MSNNNKRLPFIIGSSYLLSFIFIRMMVIIAGSVKHENVIAIKEGAIKTKLYIGRNIIINGYHIHHFYFGVLLLAVAGWLSITRNKYFSKVKLAIMYGVGLGLFMDEIGMLLSEGDYYSSLSYLLGLFLLGILMNIIYFPPFWNSIKNNFADFNLSGVKIIAVVFKKFIQTLDFFSRGIMHHRKAIFIIILILIIIDFLLPYIIKII